MNEPFLLMVPAKLSFFVTTGYSVLAAAYTNTSEIMHELARIRER